MSPQGADEDPERDRPGANLNRDISMAPTADDRLRGGE